MDPATILSILSAVAAAMWTAWTWREEQKEVRQLQRDQAAAFYVNPLLLAAHQLERQLDRLLDGRRLILSNREDGNRDRSVSGAAIEALWTFAEFFAWATVNLRYGPYARDPVVIGLIVAISRTLDDRERFADSAFRFSAAEQESLGDAVLRRVGHTSSQVGKSSAPLTEFAIVTAVDFERDFRDAQSTKAGLYGGQAVRRAVKAIDRAELGGRERLATVQQLLKRLLVHLERLEKFSISPERIVADASVDLASMRVLHRMKGRIRLGIAQVRTHRDFADRLAALIRTWNGVEDVSINVMAGSVTIRYRTTEPDDDFQAGIVAAIEKAIHPNGHEPAGVEDGIDPRRRIHHRRGSTGRRVKTLVLGSRG